MNDYMKAITYNHPERIPISVSLLPATWAKYGEDLKKLCLRHPDLFANVREEEELKYSGPAD